MKITIRTFFIFLLIFLVPIAFSESTRKQIDRENVHLNDQTIQIEEIENDRNLTLKLRKLFDTVGWYNDVTVEVKQGIVFLNGIVSDKSHRTWATDFLKQVDGSVGVVNELKVASPKPLDLQPAVAEVNQITNDFSKKLPYLASALIVFLIFILLAGFVLYFSKKILRRKFSSLLFADALSRIIAAPLLLVGIYFLIKLSGLDGLAATILGGSGLVGLMIGLSLKGTAENYVSSLMISLKKTFTKGDLVEIAGQKGVVHSVTTTGTTLIDYDGNHIVLPNSQVFSSTIKNFTTNPKARSSFGIGIGYADSINSAKSLILKEIAAFDNHILKDPEPSVLVEQLGASTVNLKVYFWVNVHKSSAAKIKSLLIQRVKEVFMDECISMPDDAREVIFTKPLQIDMLEKKKESSSISKKVSENKSKTSTKHASTEDLNSEIDELKKQGDDSAPKNESDSLV